MEAASAPHHPDPKPAQPPVMDVVPPKPTEPPKAPPKEERDNDPPPTPHSAEAAHHKPDKPAVAKPPKQPGSGVGLAIFATIVIVLCLGALFTYAYLRTNNISIF
jgi:hypothetical protein